MAPRMTQWLQRRHCDSPTKGLAWTDHPGQMWLGARLGVVFGNGNRESDPFPVTVTGPPSVTVLRPTLAGGNFVWWEFEGPEGPETWRPDRASSPRPLPGRATARLLLTDHSLGRTHARTHVTATLRSAHQKHGRVRRWRDGGDAESSDENSSDEPEERHVPHVRVQPSSGGFRVEGLGFGA